MHLAASKNSIECKATVLVDWGEGVKIQVPASYTWCYQTRSGFGR